MTDVIQETDEQKATRIRRVKARKALTAAPGLAYQLRWDSTPLDGRTERGWLPELRTPLLTEITDAADYLYTRLHGWVGYWAGQLDVVLPVAYGWRNLQHPDAPLLGLSSAATPETAHNLVTSVSAWLLWHENDIEALRSGEVIDYLDDVPATIWNLRQNTRVKQAEITEPSLRTCPRGHLDVQIEFFGEPMESAEARGERLDVAARVGETEEHALNEFALVIAGITIRCTRCGWSPPLTASKIARWLTPDAINPVGPVLGPERASLRRPSDRNYPKTASA
jgi:hypothetical protein